MGCLRFHASEERWTLLACLAAIAIRSWYGCVMPMLQPLVMATGDLFRSEASDLLASAPAGPVCVWAGTTADEPFGIDPRAWMPRARAELFERLRQLCQLASAQAREVWMRPHARHAVGDLPIIAKWCIEPPAANFRVLLDPCSLLTAQMLPLAEDHLGRIFGAAAGQFVLPRLAGVVVANVRLPEGLSASASAGTLAIDDGPALQLVPLSEGVIPVAVIKRLAAGLPESVARFGF